MGDMSSSLMFGKQGHPCARPSCAAVMEATASLAAHREKFIERRRHCGDNGLFRETQAYFCLLQLVFAFPAAAHVGLHCSERAGVASIMPLSFANRMA
jgi:hypothetical protein